MVLFPPVIRATGPSTARGASVALLLTTAAACGAPAAPTALEPTQPWSDTLVAVFDDSADWVTPLRTLLGTPWFDEYAATLERRLAEADVVAVVRLKTIVPAPAASASGALEVEVERPLTDNVVVGQLLRLEVSPEAAERLEAERARLEDQQRFVVYVRLFRGELQEVRNHWHLSPADPDLVNTIRRTAAP
jgi:hypothetical protein